MATTTSRNSFTIYATTAGGRIRTDCIFASTDPSDRANALSVIQDKKVTKIINLGDCSHSCESANSIALEYPVRLNRLCPTACQQQNEWIYVDFASSLRPVLLRRLSILDRIKLSFIGLNEVIFGGRRGAIDYYNERTLLNGLDGLYRDWVDYCGDAVVAALDAVLECVSESREAACLMHCEQGGRTLLLLSIILRLMGVAPEELLQSLPPASPAQQTAVMQAMEHIEHGYHGVEAYLAAHGMPAKQQRQLIHYLN